MGSRQPGAMVAMRTTCPFSGSRRSGLMWMPGPIASLSSGIWSMLTVSRSSCGKATNGSGTPLLVRNMPGETGADIMRTFRRCVRISVFRTGYPDGAELYCASRLVASPCPESSPELASVGRMPARPHRTVDRVVEILETVSLSPRGVTLAELATAMGAAKSSVQELTNGLLARGYLIEEDRRF